jgi:hypothetical protein
MMKTGADANPQVARRDMAAPESARKSRYESTPAGDEVQKIDTLFNTAVAAACAMLI